MMAFCTVLFRAPSIVKDTGMCVLLPKGAGPFPVLYLLHGMSDDYTSWHRRTGLERYVQGLRLIVVMPDGHRSRYCNDPRPGGMAYEDHIIKDVVGLTDRTFPTIPHRTARAIAGLSMGGYGSLMLAMRHLEMFSVSCSHSGGGRFAKHRRQAKQPGSLAAALATPKYD
jgi:putative tributyrin esterase